MKRLTVVLSVIASLALACWIYVRTHPLVFSESFWQHEHCAKQVGMALRMYAQDHNGAYPSHTNGYGDALLLLWGDTGSPSLLTGPGYSDKVFGEAYTNKTDVPESKCGRVYIQGLREDSDPDIVVLFDKLPNPGDHCNGPRRIWAPLCREVVLVDGSMQAILEKNWPAFASNQVELLVKAGFSRATAEDYYPMEPVRR